jgi:thiol-disulfide isomerase/thioredoxin
VVVALIVWPRGGSSDGVAFAGDLRRGGALEQLSLPRLESDGKVDYAAYTGRPLVINFFASWCPFCIGEMPDFERVHQAAGDRVAFLGISQRDPRQASIDLLAQTGVTYQTAIDADGDFFDALGGIGMPVTVFVAPDGRIADIYTGPLNAEALTRLIALHFGVTV